MKLRQCVSVALTVVHWTLLLVTLFYLLTGFGITQFRIVQAITFGLLTKPLAFTLHDILWIPFLSLARIACSLHIVATPAETERPSVKRIGSVQM